jgi:hypothetical protein
MSVSNWKRFPAKRPEREPNQNRGQLPSGRSLHMSGRMSVGGGRQYWTALCNRREEVAVFPTFKSISKKLHPNRQNSRTAARDALSESRLADLPLIIHGSPDVCLGGLDQCSCAVVVSMKPPLPK